jgi:hypothetical protein
MVETNKVDYDPVIFAAMQSQEPYCSYIKGILGRVHLMALDPMTKQPVGVMLEGDPNTKEPTTIIDLWSEWEDLYFRRMNKKFLDEGTLLIYKKPVEAPKEKTLEAGSQEDLSSFLKGTYITIQNKLAKVTSEALLFRLISLARQQEKPEKIIKILEARLAEIQLNQTEFVNKLDIEK